MEHLNNDDDVELTPEEIQAVLSIARNKKAAQIREKKYWDKLSQPVEYPKFTAEEMGRYAKKKIKQLIPSFVVDDANRATFKLLCQYFAGDPEFEKTNGFSLDKGILLLGPVGCGKTTLLRCFTANPTNSYVEVSCRKVAADYADKSVGGSHTITYYSSLKEVFPNDYFGQRHVGFFFDDLGTEQSRKHYGNESNVMEEILLNRYDSVAMKGKTHMTTNLTADQMEQMYGSRVRSRIREMFNWMPFDHTAADRRK